jgi:hypothetical protein
MPAPIQVTVFGVSYKSITAACAAYGHREPKVRHRMVSKSLTLEQALVAKEGNTGVKMHPSYQNWNAIRSRCFSKRSAGYKNYGAKGITMCDRWKNDFYAFASDMGPKPSRLHTVDRIDNAIGYQPGNCRWATRKEQQRNTRRNVMLEYGGIRLCQKDWAARLGVTGDCMRYRRRSGIPQGLVFSTENFKGTRLFKKIGKSS